jgi:putative phosphonate catabolism associated alcohol dehydrogenase
MIPSQATLALFDGPGSSFRLATVDLRPPGPGELLVEVSLATICGSDLHTVDGRRSCPTPCVLGHEGVGKVVAAGSGRPEFQPGRRITWTLADSCGCCRPCIDWALPQKCEHLFKYGHAPADTVSDLNGCFATHILLRPGTTVVPLPDSVSDAAAVPANCALATLFAATEAVPHSGNTALIQGAGLLGLYGCSILRSRGWKRVLVSDPNPSRRARVVDFGGEPVSPEELHGLSASVVDAVLEVAGRAEVIGEGIRLLRPGGHYSWIGMVHPETALDITGESVVRKCLTVHGTHNYGPRHLRQAVEYLSTHTGPVPLESLVSPAFPLSRLDEAFACARSGTWPRVAVSPGS